MSLKLAEGCWCAVAVGYVADSDSETLILTERLTGRDSAQQCW